MDKEQFGAYVDAKFAEIKSVFMSHWPNAQQPPPPPAPADPSLKSWDFKDMTDISERPEVDWQIQAKANDRVKIIPNAFGPGVNGIRLTTLPGDNNVFQSAEWERCDLRLNNNAFRGQEGQENWIAVSTLLPDDYEYPDIAPLWSNGLLWTFHSMKPGDSQGPFKLETRYEQANVAGQLVKRVVLRLRGFAGASKGGWEKNLLNNVRPPKNIRFDSVAHIKWHPTAGFVNFWLRSGGEGGPVETHKYVGATMYPGYPTHFKLDNYHAPYSKPCSVIHGRVRIGKSAAVSAFPIP